MSEETKLKAFGLFKAHQATNPTQTFDYEHAAETLDVKATQIRKWSKDFMELDRDESVANLVSVDDVMLERIAKELDEDLEAVEPRHELFVNPVTGAVEVKLPGEAKESGRAKKIAAFKDNVHGLQLLDQDVRATAGILVEQISYYAQTEELNSRDIASLANALTSIQNAFFNKPVTNVQVNNISGEEGSTLLKSLRERLKP